MCTKESGLSAPARVEQAENRKPVGGDYLPPLLSRVNLGLSRLALRALAHCEGTTGRMSPALSSAAEFITRGLPSPARFFLGFEQYRRRCQQGVRP